jgi:hypothetical protein
MRSIPRLAGAGALFLASSLALTVSADAGGHMGFRPASPGFAHPSHGFSEHSFHSFGEHRHFGEDFGRHEHFFHSHATGGLIGALGFDTAGGYGEDYAQGVPEVGETLGTPEQRIYAAEPQAYSRTFVVPTVVYHTVTQNYSVPVRTYRTETHVHYVPVTSYRAVTTEVQVPVTAYQTYQRTVQVPETVYRRVHKTCGCSYSDSQ